MKAEEYGQWCRNVSEHRPAKRTVEVQLDRRALAPSRFQRVDSPHREIADQQESDHLSARLAAYLRFGNGLKGVRKTILGILEELIS